jgi:predicted alpha/beta superfamily hydrolase
MGPSRKLALGSLLAVVLVAVPMALVAQDNGDPVIIGNRYSVHSQILDEDRPVWVHTPTGYEGSLAHYPVIYVLDGSDHFHHTSGTMEFLAANQRMPHAIVVAVPNTSDRTHDLTPPVTVPDTAHRFPTAGGADDFLRFLREELQPWMEREYRTAPYSILIGHSFGGLFAAHTLINQPAAFDAYISISPSLWWDEESWKDKAESLFEDHADLDGSLYMTMGNEGGMMLAGAWGFTRILETSAPESFRWKWVPMPAEDHGSVPHRSTYDGLEWLFDGWQFPDFFQVVMEQGDSGMAKVDEHYAELTERFGYDIRVPETTMNELGYFLIRQERVDDAIRVLASNVRRYPESANVYDSLGDAFDAACRWEEAREHYSRAYEMARTTSHPNTEAYRANRDRIAAKIRAGMACTPPGEGGR